jgi:hypothetical protein
MFDLASWESGTERTQVATRRATHGQERVRLPEMRCAVPIVEGRRRPSYMYHVHRRHHVHLLQEHLAPP